MTLGAAGSGERCEACEGELQPWPLDDANTLLRCTSCGHVRRDLASCPAGHRDLAYGGDPGLDAVRTWLTHRRLVAAAPRAGRVFEVGFGPGALLRRFLDEGASVGGTDPGHLAARVDPQVASRGELHALPVEQLAPDPTHDLVVGVHVLEHARDPHAFLAACAGLLRPGGTLALLTPDGGSALLPLVGSAWWMLEDPTHVRFLTERSGRALLARAGMVDVRVSRPLLDSATTEAASLARRLRRTAPGPHGVLSSRGVRLAGLAGLPVSVAARVVRPGLRPTLFLVATRRTDPS